MCWERSSFFGWLEVSLGMVQNYTWILYLNIKERWKKTNVPILIIYLSTILHYLLDRGGELVIEKELGEHGAVLLQVVDTQHTAVAVVVAVVSPPVTGPHRLQPSLLSLLSLKQSIVLLTQLPIQQTSCQVRRSQENLNSFWSKRPFKRINPSFL